MGDWLSKMALRHAERLASAQKYEQASEILQAIAAEDEATQSRSQILAQEVQAEWLAQLRQRFPDYAVCPVRIASIQEMKQAGLRSFDAYVFSLVDGITSIEDIIALSAANEAATLASLRKLHDLRLVAMQPPL